MPGMFGIDGIVLVLVGFGIAFFVSRFAFAFSSEGSVAANATAGLLSNAFWATAALFLMLGGGIGFLIGLVILIFVMYLARGHLKVLDEENVRQRIAG